MLWPQYLVDYQVSDLFKPLVQLSGPIQMPCEGAVWNLWVECQTKNRKQINEVGADNEKLSARLASVPTHVLKTAITYEACRAVLAGHSALSEFTLETLETAIAYVEEHMRAAQFLDQYAQRRTVQEQAAIILATVRKDFQAQRPDTIFVTRTDLTRKFCMHTGRQGALTVENLFLRVLPELERQGEACLAYKRAKFEAYAFRTELNP